MKNMKSFLQFDVMPKIGDQIHVTIDCFTACGSISLVGEKSQVERDHARIRQLEPTMFIVN
jgi:hypothetical protein